MTDTQGNTALFITATLKMYGSCAWSATKQLAKGWPIILGSIAAYYFWQFMVDVFLGANNIGGQLLLGFISIALITLFYGWIADLVEDGELPFRSLFQFDYMLFFQVMGVAFVLMIAEWILLPFDKSGVIPHALMFFHLGTVFLCNALPEVLYIHRMTSIDALRDAFVFTRDNWIEWYLPFVILLAPMLFLSFEITILLFSRSHEFLPPFLIVTTWRTLTYLYGATFLGNIWLYYLVELFILLLGIWFMLLRASLFKELLSGGRRQRMFQARMNN